MRVNVDRLEVYERDPFVGKLLDQSIKQISKHFPRYIDKSHSCKIGDFKVDLQPIVHTHIQHRLFTNSQMTMQFDQRPTHIVGKNPNSQWIYQYHITPGNHGMITSIFSSTFTSIYSNITNSSMSTIHMSSSSPTTIIFKYNSFPSYSHSLSSPINTTSYSSYSYSIISIISYFISFFFFIIIFFFYSFIFSFFIITHNTNKYSSYSYSSISIISSFSFFFFFIIIFYFYSFIFSFFIITHNTTKYSISSHSSISIISSFISYFFLIISFSITPSYSHSLSSPNNTNTYSISSNSSISLISHSITSNTSEILRSFPLSKCVYFLDDRDEHLKMRTPMNDYLDQLLQVEPDLNVYEIAIKFKEFCHKYIWEDLDQQTKYQHRRTIRAIEAGQQLPDFKEKALKYKAIPHTMIFPMDMIVGSNIKHGILHFVFYNGSYELPTDTLAANSTKGTSLGWFGNYSTKMHESENKHHPHYAAYHNKLEYKINDKKIKKYTEIQRKKIEKRKKEIKNIYNRKYKVMNIVQFKMKNGLLHNGPFIRLRKL